jgi:hypothetical protein
MAKYVLLVAAAVLLLNLLGEYILLVAAAVLLLNLLGETCKGRV